MSSAAQDLRDERFARATDRDVAPIWHDRFSTLAWRHLPELPSGLILDVHSGVGRTTAELLSRTSPEVRVVGLEPSRAMRDLAKARVQPQWKQRVYFKPGDFSDLATMAADTYDLVLCNVVLSEAQDTQAALGELIRVTKPGGTILATFPMAGSWVEAEDIFAEVLRDEGLDEAVARLDRLATLRPSGPDIAKLVSQLGIEDSHAVLEQERFSLLFNSAREFLFSPLVEYGPLRLWKAILGQAANPQEIFFRFKAAIDAYFGRSVFEVSAIAGVLQILRPGGGDSRQLAEEYWSRYPILNTIFDRAEGRTSGSDMGLEFDIDIDIEDLGDDDVGAIPAVIEDEGDTAPRFIGGEGRRTAASISAEDEAIFALLDQPSHRNEPDAELDALLDQVLEYAEPDAATRAADMTLEPAQPEGLAPVGPRDVKKPGETLKRIKALLPPPPEDQVAGAGTSPQTSARPNPRPPGRGAVPPPPPPVGNLKRKKR